MPRVSIQPDGLKWERSVEETWDMITGASGGRLTVDMKDVTWVRPYGLVTLLLACRVRHEETGRCVFLANIPPKIRAYLDRADFFQVGQDWVEANGELPEEWQRSQNPLKLLEVTKVTTVGDLNMVVNRCQTLLGRHIAEEPARPIARALGELADNARYHSGDYGLVAAQVYEYNGSVAEVHVAVADLGVGIPARLYPEYPNLDAGRLVLTAVGSSNPAIKTPGTGLPTVRRHATGGGGTLWVRCEKVEVLCTATRRRARPATCTQGTRISAVFRARHLARVDLDAL